MSKLSIVYKCGDQGQRYPEGMQVPSLERAKHIIFKRRRTDLIHEAWYGGELIYVDKAWKKAQKKRRIERKKELAAIVKPYVPTNKQIQVERWEKFKRLFMKKNPKLTDR